MNTKRILMSLAAIVFAGGAVAGGTGAFFSDEETSTGNTFTAGAIDLTVDSEAHYNGMVCNAQGVWEQENPEAEAPDYPKAGDKCVGTWTVTDLGPTHTFFAYQDIKPGDNGENTISLHVENNEAWACAIITPTMNDDVSSTEPELEVPGESENTDSIFDGELAQSMNFKIWADTCDVSPAVPGDNIYQAGCDTPLTEGTGPIIQTAYPIVTPQVNAFGTNGDPMAPGVTRYLGIEWSIPTTVGNEAQTDKYVADISFYVEQSRNNPNFKCPELVAPDERTTLRLENEIINDNGPWTVIQDDIYVDLTWQGDGSTFDYTLAGKALAPNTQYSLIYYADGWPGNNPGALIGTHMSDGAGMIAGAGNPDLGIDLPSLPDGNYALGAKIWLVPSSDYDAGTKSMTAWNPANYLFEGNVYIKYNDTNN